MKGCVLFSLLALVNVWNASSGSHQCPQSNDVVPMRDVRDAVRCSRNIYTNKNLRVGTTIPGTQFKVKMVYNPKRGHDNFKVCVAERGNVTMVVFRGTHTSGQLIRQLWFQWKNKKGDKHTIASVRTRINTYFLIALNLLFPQVKSYLREPNRRYVLTGHSFGGALASILAVKMTQEYNGSIWEHPQSSLITFGQPRVGNQAYADLHDKLISPWRKFRFVVRKDPVSKIPFGPDFVHHSSEIFMSYESARRCWLCGKSKQYYWRVCGKQEDERCSQRYDFSYIVKDHSSKLYQKRILQSPTIFKNVHGKNKGSFREAILSSC